MPKRSFPIAGFAPGVRAKDDIGAWAATLGKHESMDYPRWRAEHLFVMVPAQQYVAQFLATFREFPPSQKVGSFALDNVLEALTKGAGDK